MPHINTGYSGSSERSLPESLHNRKVIKSFKPINKTKLRPLRQKLVAQKVAQEWVVRIQIARKLRSTCFLYSTIKSMGKTYEEWRLIGAN
tara:strand:+ start:1606 stop:1875 length:270 start_codon:yes stop_codon:yes gene_type:complete